jgi:uncharacterized membrane protein YoaK (UPF0700 family)
VFLGLNAALGKWHEAAHHLPPILAFLAGACVANRIRAPLLCLAGEVVALTAVMLSMRHAAPEPLSIVGASFGVALQTVSFRQVERWKYLSVTVTGNMIRGIEQLALPDDPLSMHGAKSMLAVCVMFLLGAAAGGYATMHLAESGLVLPIALLLSALWLCTRDRAGRR